MKSLILSVLVVLSALTLVNAADNSLTDQERSDGWLLLFDGQTTKGWMSPKEKPLADKHVQDGSLNPHPCDYYHCAPSMLL